jgi:hypothetical protein
LRKQAFGGAAVTIKQVFSIAVALMIVSTAGGALAVTPYKDKAASAKIDEAINVHYIAAQFDKAEAVLLAAVKTCGKQDCSAEVLAKAYLYLGIIRGNGKQDIAGAKSAFELAYAADPNITIDPSLVTPAVLEEFNKATGKQVAAAPANKSAETDENIEIPGEKKVATKARVAPVGELICAPATGYVVQVGRPIPIHCEKMEGVLRGELYYKPVGSEDYSAQLMKFNQKDASLSGQVPCEAITKKGTISVYVVAQDENRELVETFGNALSPVQYTVVEKPSLKPTMPAPALPGEPAPEVCTEMLNSIRNGRGPGQVCTHAEPCRKDNYCNNGICEKAPTCEMGSDCSSGHCIDGLCVMNEVFEDDKKYNKWLVGINAAMDLWISPTKDNVCGGTNPANGVFNCYNEGTSKINNDAIQAQSPANTVSRSNRLPMADPNWGGNVKTTLIPATVRVLASVERVVATNVTLGGRVGFAFRGGPAKITYDPTFKPSQGAPFLPVHLELRAAYWFQPIEDLGHHFYIAAGGGIAEVDGKVTVRAFADDSSGKPRVERHLDAWRKLGIAFATLSAGENLRVSKHLLFQLNLNTMVMFPSVGLVLEPSLGGIYAF